MTMYQSTSNTRTPRQRRRVSLTRKRASMTCSHEMSLRSCGDLDCLSIRALQSTLAHMLRRDSVLIPAACCAETSACVACSERCGVTELCIAGSALEEFNDSARCMGKNTKK